MSGTRPNFDMIRDRLKEGRDNLGGFGEPVWSQALMELDNIEKAYDKAVPAVHTIEIMRDYEQFRWVCTCGDQAEALGPHFATVESSALVHRNRKHGGAGHILGYPLRRV